MLGHLAGYSPFSPLELLTESSCRVSQLASKLIAFWAKQHWRIYKLFSSAIHWVLARVSLALYLEMVFSPWTKFSKLSAIKEVSSTFTGEKRSGSGVPHLSPEGAQVYLWPWLTEWPEVPCILKSLAGMIERERTSRNWRGILYCAVSLWFESWLHSEVLGKAHSQAEGPFSCRDTSCLWGKGYQWRLFASMHKNEVSVLEEFIDFKKERMK